MTDDDNDDDDDDDDGDGDGGGAQGSPFLYLQTPDRPALRAATGSSSNSNSDGKKQHPCVTTPRRYIFCECGAFVISTPNEDILVTGTCECGEGGLLCQHLPRISHVQSLLQTAGSDKALVLTASH